MLYRFYEIGHVCLLAAGLIYAGVLLVNAYNERPDRSRFEIPVAHESSLAIR